MKITLNLKTKIISTIVITFLISAMLLLEHFRGGVVSHHLFHNENLPRISNWWGLLILPTVCWVTLSLIQKDNIKNENTQNLIKKSQIYGFIAGFLFGVTLTILFYNSLGVLNYLLLLTFALALFIPIYKPEYYLGFILSMSYGFGGILPVIFGLVLIAIYAIEYKFIRKSVLYVINSIKR